MSVRYLDLVDYAAIAAEVAVSWPLCDAGWVATSSTETAEVKDCSTLVEGSSATRNGSRWGWKPTVVRSRWR